MYWEVKKIKKEDFEMNIFEKTELLKFVSQLENNVDELESVFESLESAMLIGDYYNVSEAVREITNTISILKTYLNKARY
jgi:hypothetical protein